MPDSSYVERGSFLSAEDVLEKIGECFNGRNWKPVVETSSAAIVTLKTPAVITFFKRFFETGFVFLSREKDGSVIAFSAEKLSELSQISLQAALQKETFDEDFLEVFDLFKEAPEMIEKFIAHFSLAIAEKTQDLIFGLRELKILYEKVRKKTEIHVPKLALHSAVTAIFKLDSSLMPVVEEDIVDFLKAFPPEAESENRFINNQILLGVGEYDRTDIAVQISRVETMIRELQRYARNYMPWLSVAEERFTSFIDEGFRKHPSLKFWLEGIKSARTEYGLSQEFWVRARRWYFEKIGDAILPDFQRAMTHSACWAITEERQIKDPLSNAGETTRYSARRNEAKIRRDEEEPDGIYVLCSLDELLITSEGLRKSSRDFPYDTLRYDLREIKLSREGFLDSKDARFAGYTWKHLLPGGGPDKTVKNNERVECFIYYCVSVLSVGYGVPLIKLFFAREESAKLFITFMNKAAHMAAWKEYQQNGLPAPLKAKHRINQSRDEKAEKTEGGSQGDKTVEDVIAESLSNMEPEMEREDEKVESVESNSLSPELVEKINALHYELEWALKKNRELTLSYHFPGVSSQVENPKKEVASYETKTVTGFTDLEAKIESLSSKTKQTVCKILSGEPQREYSLEELGLSFWSVFVVAPKITSGGKPLIEVMSGTVPRVVWGRNFDAATRDLLKARFALNETR